MMKIIAYISRRSSLLSKASYLRKDKKLSSYAVSCISTKNFSRKNLNMKASMSFVATASAIVPALALSLTPGPEFVRLNKSDAVLSQALNP